MNCMVTSTIAIYYVDANADIDSIAVSVCYWLVAASIAELASGMPSASGGMLTGILS
jgi:hypothetical protein